MTGFGSRRGGSGVVSRPSQMTFVVLPAKEDSNDDDIRSRDVKHDRRTPLEAQRPQAGSDVVAPGSPSGEDFERQAGGFDPIDIGSGNVVASLGRDMTIKVEKVGFCLRAKADVISPHAASP
jgi:hypothetical protein